MKILITGGTSIQALKLSNTFVDATVILADYGDAPKFPSGSYRFISLGVRNDDIIAHNLLTICLDQSVDTLLPLYGFEIEQIAKSSILFKEFDIEVFMPEKGQMISG